MCMQRKGLDYQYFIVIFVVENWNLAVQKPYTRKGKKLL